MKQVWILGGLLAVAMGASWWTHQRGAAPEVSPHAVSVLKVDPSALKQVTWTSEHQSVTLRREEDKGGEYIVADWREDILEVPQIEQPAMDDEEAPAMAPPTPAPVVVGEKAYSFRASTTAQDTWAELAGLNALRGFDTRPDLSPFGLASPTESLELLANGQTLLLELGGETFGVRNRYAKLDDRILVLDSEMIAALSGADIRLVERRTQPIPGPAADRVVLNGTFGTADLVQQDKDDPTRAWWSYNGGDQKDEANTLLIEKLLRLRVQGYKNELPADSKPIFDFTVFGDDQTWRVEVLQAPDESWYAQSEFNHGIVQLTTSLAEEAQQAVSELQP